MNHINHFRLKINNYKVVYSFQFVVNDVIKFMFLTIIGSCDMEQAVSLIERLINHICMSLSFVKSN